MNYIIKNLKQVYIKLDGNGSPIVCGENCKQLYEFSKAKNILDHLPKNLRRLGFRVEAVSEIGPQKKETIEAGAYAGR